jgi:protein-S-isoprenylcysteine O-methyltransferase Ste14
LERADFARKMGVCVAPGLHFGMPVSHFGTSRPAPHFPLTRRQSKKAARAMNRISGTLAVLAGFFLLLPGVFAMFHTAASTAPMPVWLIRDLAVVSFSGAVILYWGASAIRHREMELNDVQPIRVRARR